MTKQQKENTAQKNEEQKEPHQQKTDFNPKADQQQQHKQQTTPAHNTQPETKTPLDECKKHLDETTALLQRVQADFENYKKRCHKDYETITKNANKQLIANLLPILDSFQFALKSTTNQENFIKGIELIYSQFYSALETQGVRKIEAVGKKFDPYKHEVLLQEKSEKGEDIILEELQAGYMLGDVVLRYSKVKVATK
ncbi:nucleotide exchange factor GrpE [Candidatus Woesearchaeota archaeon]|nr:nucleotide exchange factor GrpE [Candidatus Woesearchaeota archaeon]